ncbi:glycoside hydrolase superfamily [Phascolomyces articulosus]|uniref:Glycoside hydrolase superfamily n=1 Tax=Phascolomyces articulosus TaxID=60185 RepID=A0AAD5K108_9FUNG|nr:glycoside hydrolase superfamily [Phascolomyces articulosus]
MKPFSPFTILASAATVLSLFSNTGVQAATGVDVSTLISEKTWACAKDYGYEHAIVRGYIEAWGQNPGGALDKNLVQNYKNAIAAGYETVDIYIFPCTGRDTCKSATQQIQDVLDVIDENSMKIGTLWLDVEVDPQADNWPTASGARSTLQAYKKALDNSGEKWGIYANKVQWTSITGSSTWELDSSVPLWYPHYDNERTFDDFEAFGGWTKPTIKQYAGTSNFCSAGWDKNYYG